MKDLLGYALIVALALVLGYAVLSEGVITPVSELVTATAERIRTGRN